MGTILRASALLTQNPAPPVAKEKWTFFYKEESEFVRKLVVLSEL